MLFGAVWFLTSRRTKGKAGELMVGLVLRGLGSREYRVLNNIYLPLPDGTTSRAETYICSEQMYARRELAIRYRDFAPDWDLAAKEGRR